jgi:branched-chain amino acid transport system substrate-binding protein
MLARRYFLLLSFSIIHQIFFPSTSTFAAPVLKVGFLHPLTGKYSDTGQSHKAGAEFIVEEINSAGGIRNHGGAKIQLVLADTTSQIAPIYGEMERLCTIEKVSVIHGPYTTDECSAAAPVGERHGIPSIAITSTGDTVYPLKLKFWRTISIPTEELGRFHVSTLGKLVQEFKIKHDRVALLYPNNDFGKLCVGKASKDELQKQGYKIVMDLAYDWRAADLVPVMLKLKGVNPDVIIQQAYLADGINSHKARFSTDLYPTMVGGVTGYSNIKLWPLVGHDIARKTLQTGFFGASWFEEVSYKPLQDFLKKAKPWAEAKGLVVDDAFVYAAQGMLAIKEAAERAKSIDPKAINEALRQLSIPIGSPSLILPNYNPTLCWSEVGKTLNCSLLVIQWNEGKKEVIYPKELRTAPPKLR